MAETAGSSTAAHEDAACDDWLRQVAALTVAPPSGSTDDEIATATATAVALVSSARSLVARRVVAPDGCESGCGGCADASLSCALVRRLAATPLAVAPNGTTRRPTAPTSAPIVQQDGEPAQSPADLERYRQLLTSAAGAVFTCRRTLHASDACLFGSSDLCGRVLAAAHRLG